MVDLRFFNLKFCFCFYINRIDIIFIKIYHRAIKKTVKGFARPQLDLSIKAFAKVMDKAFGRIFVPPFNPYANPYNYLIASYLVPYVGLTGYVGANPKLQCPESRKVTKSKIVLLFRLVFIYNLIL